MYFNWKQNNLVQTVRKVYFSEVLGGETEAARKDARLEEILLVYE